MVCRVLRYDLADADLLLFSREPKDALAGQKALRRQRMNGPRPPSLLLLQVAITRKTSRA